MGSAGLMLWQWVAALGAAGLVALTAIFAPSSLKAKIARYRWWFLGLLVIALGWFFLSYLHRNHSSAKFPSSALPEEFRPGYWQWMYVFLMGALASGLAMLVQYRRIQASSASDPDAGRFPDIDSAWQDIRLRFAQAKIDATTQKFFLLLSPSEDVPAAVIDSAGLQIFAQGPPEAAPIHAFATSDGVFLTISGASRLGQPDNPLAAARIEHVCRLILSLNPDCPVVRALVVVLPIDWCSRPESIKESAGIRDDLQTVQRVLEVRCPIFTLFASMEHVPGFLDFAARLGAQVSRQMLDQRVGFAIPNGQEFSGDLVQRGLVWQSGWFHVWSLNLLAGEPLNERVNSELVTLDAEFRRYRRRLRSVLEAALSTHQGTTPVLFRGCYFVANGARREDRAFSAGLLRGARSRIVADSLASDWSEEAVQSDRRYFRGAMGIGVVGLLGCLYVWSFIWSRTPTFALVGVIALSVVWLLGGFWMMRKA